MPNIHRLLKKNNVDIEQHTAGEYKRTLTVLGENTDKGREKFLEDLTKTHTFFKQHVAKYRKNIDMTTVATGEIWYGQEALEKGLVDELGTSAEFLSNAIENGAHVYKVKWEEKKKGVLQKIGISTEHAMIRTIDHIWEKLTTRFLT